MTTPAPAREHGASLASSYDDVPYAGRCYPQTHPDRLATLATLFGLTPAPVERCRVLELGCALGGNLVPMAFHLPDSEFVGVDSSRRQVAAARASASALDLTNVRVEHASILDVDGSWGTFDYLICHDVYSWVPAEVQDKILAIAAENLAPQGIAYVSYNTYPGWHMREMIRHMMRYHAGRFPETPDRIEQARALLDFLAASVDANTFYGALLKNELRKVNRMEDWYLFHEHLEEVNAPICFHEFVAHAGRHDLRYLAEADFSAMLTSGFPAHTSEALERISPDIVHAEQYMDFLRNRPFRETLLCRAEQVPKRALEARDLSEFLLASPVLPEPTRSGRLPAFRTPDGGTVTSQLPLTHAVLTVLSESWPRAIDSKTLFSLALDRIASPRAKAQVEQEWVAVLQDMLRCFSSGAVELRTWQAECTNRVGTTPQISRLAAHEARLGPVVTNQRHEPIPLDPVGRCLAPVLDGTRDRAALLGELAASVARGELVFERHGRPITDDLEYRRVLDTALEQNLNGFARCALLVG